MSVLGRTKDMLCPAPRLALRASGYPSLPLRPQAPSGRADHQPAAGAGRLGHALAGCAPGYAAWGVRADPSPR